MNWTSLVDGLLPAHCQFCGAAGVGPVCAACQADLPWNQPACPGCALPAPLPDLPCPACQHKPRVFDAAFAAFRYATPGSQALQGLKYGARFHEARWLAESLATALRQRQAALPQRLIPVPLHPGRLRRRGYNQAQELARHLGKALDIPVAPKLARRLRATPDQIGLSAPQRRLNLRGAFAVGKEVAGLHVALLDDVMTTGATLEELARACKAAGAARVEAWALARQPLGGNPVRTAGPASPTP